MGASNLKYQATVSNQEQYTLHTTGTTSEAQLIWMALNEAGWADHPYTVDRTEDEITVVSQRLAASMRITPVR